MLPEDTLPSVFVNILKLFSEVKNFNGSSSDRKFKDLICRSCKTCEYAIQMVNELQLFSKNESLDDLATAYIRYLTLPAFLGFFTCQKAEKDERLIALQLAQTFYKEFITLVKSYGIPDLPNLNLENPSGDGCSNVMVPTGPPVSRNTILSREEKIRAYKQKKALEQRLVNFINLEFATGDEEFLRKESLALVSYWAYTTVEELKMSYEEISILSQISAGQLNNQSSASNASSREQQKRTAVPPLIITRERICAAVFGAGYPSVPTMTLDQFVDLQIHQGLMAPSQTQKENHNNSSSSTTQESGSWNRVDGSVGASEADERKAERQDAAEDADCEEARARTRRFDEFKDDNRRGSGNRANRS